MFVLMAFALLLVLAHLGWLIGLWERLRPFGAEWPGAALCVLAALTPLLGLVAALAEARHVPEDRSFAMCLKPFGFWRPIPSQ